MKRSFSGKYVYGETIFHHANPALKLCLIFLFSTFVILERHFIALLADLVFAFWATRICRFTPGHYKNILRSSKIFVYFSIFTALFRPSSEYYYQILFLTLSKENLLFALLLSGKILTLITLFLVFSVTTPITGLMKALNGLGRGKVKDLFFMLSLTLNFIPLIFEESQKIMQAQASRVHLDSKQGIQALKCYMQLVPPLFISTYKKAETLAMAIDSRCYGFPLKKSESLWRLPTMYELKLILLFSVSACIALISAFLF